MTNKEIKIEIIEALRNRGEYFKQINDVQYVTRCPFCGDSSNPNKGHFYIRCDPDDNFGIWCNCFKCPDAPGTLDGPTLSLLGVDDIDLKSGIGTLNKTSDKRDTKNLVDGDEFTYFDYKLPPFKRGLKTEYIEKRLGIQLGDDDFRKMKVITSLRDFLIYNNIKKLTCENYVANYLENNYIGFLSSGNSHILFRDITNKNQIRWYKYPITKESSTNRIFYAMESEVNMFTEDDIIVNLSEGILDTLSVCYNLDNNKPNTFNVSVSGKYYDRILLHLIDIGLVGGNIIVNIYADNDAEFNKKAKAPTDLKYFQRVLGTYKYLYKEINIYYNNIGKDVGVPRDQISLRHHRL